MRGFAIELTARSHFLVFIPMQNHPTLTGFTSETGHHDQVPRERPMSLAWISDELLEQTRLVWSAIYGRTLSNDESIEILVNVKRFAEVLMNAEEERKNR